MKGAAHMANINHLKDQITEALQAVHDADLLDLILKLLIIEC